ncbi:FecR family protein [Caulobacter soli]|uniref:FecR family protein n=1 Tax=Caulobacter soli TaxID=2708539 RepID=UPI0013EA6C70|nr:FecR domain-containing protein [Caulobacter soli]
MSAFLSQPVADPAEAAALWAMRLAEGEMTPEQQVAFDAWLDADPRHGALLEETVGAWRAVDHYAGAEPVMALREAALASARRTLRKGKGHFPMRQVVSGLLAATLLLAIGGGLLWARMAPQVYETGVGERRVVALKDGSKISLDAATVVKVRYAGGKRQLWLEHGRAKFDVAHDALRPFSVAAADKMVVATGTAFSVELIKTQVRVVLYEGHVAVLKRDVANGPEAGRETPVEIDHIPAEHLLAPGRELILPDNSPARLAPRAAAVEPADPVRSLSWEGGLLVFEDEPLDVVVDRMNRYAAKPLVVGDAATGRLRISGVFRAGDTEGLVQGLAAGFDVKARTSAQSIALFAGAVPRRPS